MSASRPSPPPGALPGAVRFSGAYFLLFAALGLYLPYFPVYLESRGLDGSAIGWALAAAPLLRFLVPPLFGALADRVRGPSFWAACAAWGAVAGMALVPAGPTAALVIGLLVYFLAAAPAIPLLDASLLHTLERSTARFGRVRIWGSVGFAVTAVGLGLGVPDLAPGVIVASLVASHAAFALFVSSWRVADVPPSRPPLGEIPGLLAGSRMRLLIVVLVLNRAAGGPFNGFYTLFVRDAGLGGDVVAWTWGIAVAVEVLAMLAVDRAVDRHGFAAVLAVGVLLETLRWFAYAVVTGTAALLLLAPLHGVAFAATYVAMVRGVASLVPDRHRATGQGLAAAATALGQGVGFVGAGYLYDSSGGPLMFAVAGAVGLASLAVALALAASSRREHMR